MVKIMRARVHFLHLWHMAKTEQRKLARVMFVEQGTNRKEIADKIGVREKTVGEWASTGNWDALRTEYVSRQENVVRNLKELVNRKTMELLDMENDPACDPDAKSKVFDQLSKASKALQTARGENDITLSARVRIMEWVFGELQAEHPDIYRKLVDFQENLLEKGARLHT